MNAMEIAKALGGKRYGDSWAASCPSHADRNPSLSISEGSDGIVLVKCFSGCGQNQVIAALRSLGLWNSNNRGIPRPVPPSRIQDNDHELKRRHAAKTVWQSTRPAMSTLVEAYLGSRNLALPPTTAIRFHPHLKHPEGRHWPAMVALVTDGITGSAMGVHRTFLKADGSGKASDSPAKMMLGPCRGGVVRLGIPGTSIMVAEGIETALAAMMAMEMPAWAALSTSGLRSLELGPEITEVIVLADGDDAGVAAAEACARRLQHQGRRVRITRAPPGQDFNDVLLADLVHPLEDLPND